MLFMRVSGLRGEAIQRCHGAFRGIVGVRPSNYPLDSYRLRDSPAVGSNDLRLRRDRYDFYWSRPVLVVNRLFLPAGSVLLQPFAHRIGNVPPSPCLLASRSLLLIFAVFCG